MPTPWTLHVAESEAPERTVEIVDGLVIGRHPTCGLVLTDSHVSGHHAQLRLSGAAPSITDLGSNNGTRLDADTVLMKGEQSALRAGMILRIGRVELRVDGPEVVDDADTAGAAEATIGAAEATVGAGGAAEADPETIAGDGTGPAEAEPASTVPPPAPAPDPAPAPARPVPARALEDSQASDFDSSLGMTLVAESPDAHGAEAKLTRMRGRLLILNEADMRGVDVDALEFTIGRAPDVLCRLRNQGVSSHHARIVFNSSQNLYFIEDLESGNGTQLDGAPVLPSTPRELHPDAYVRFGTIEAVFIQALDSDLQPIPEARHASAARLLANRGQLNAAVLKQATRAAQDEGKSLGELLLLGQHVKPREWARAVEDARVASTIRDLSPGGPQRLLRWALLVAAIVAVAAYFLW